MADCKTICFRCEQSGHIARNFPTAMKNTRGATQPEQMGNLELASLQSQTLVGEIQSSNCVAANVKSDLGHLVGEWLEVEVNFGRVRVPCLLDSGSMVTTEYF